jgi:hypothetical protein
MFRNDDDYLTAFAPKPVLVGAVESDFFCVEGVLECFEAAERMYALLGKEEHLELALVPGKHEYNAALRQAAVRFFTRHLLGRESAFIAAEGQDAWEPRRLWATPAGQAAASFADFTPIWTQTARHMENSLPPPPGDMGELRERLSACLKMPDTLDAPIHMRILSESQERRYTENYWIPYTRAELFFLSEPDIALGAVRYTADEARAGRCVLMALEEGAPSADWERDLIRGFITRGLDVMVMDPRGHGLVRTRDVTVRGLYEMHGTEHKLACDADMCGLNLFGLRVFDILRGARYLGETYRELELFGRGVGALWMTAAAPFVPNLKALHREDAPPSYRDMASQAYYRFDPRLKNPGILQAADMPDIVRLLRAEGVAVTEFTRPDHNTVNRW